MHHHLHRSFGRHGARSHGHFGKDFLEGGIGAGRIFGMGRKLASIDLQLLILGLLAEKPCHGYEVIKALEERSKGFYIPSPGMVYPALTYLEEIGHAAAEADGARKLYRITAAGQEYLESKRSTAEALFTQFVRVGERMDRVRRAMQAQETEEEIAVDRGGSRDLRRARKELKLALLDKWDSSADEQQRIVEILKRATSEILGK